MEVETQNASVTAPVQLQLINSSGANVEVFLFDGAKPLARHAFKFGDPPFAMMLSGLTSGSHQITVFVLAIKNLNRMYSLLVSFNHEVVAVVDGDVPTDADSESGSGQLALTVQGAP